MLFLTYFIYIYLDQPYSGTTVSGQIKVNLRKCYLYALISKVITHNDGTFVCGRKNSDVILVLKQKINSSWRHINRKWWLLTNFFFGSYPDWWLQFPQKRSGVGPGKHQTQAAGCHQHWTGRTGCSPSWTAACWSCAPMRYYHPAAPRPTAAHKKADDRFENKGMDDKDEDSSC